ncbi:MAG: MBL fold metallo-hydrolase [Verrucomicrobiota bacterium]
MSLHLQVLGNPGRDNALWVRVDTGQRIVSLLFDCGQGVLSRLGGSDVKEIDHLLFSHFHMDHIAGFDSFFRANFNRETKPIEIWGPARTIEIMQHRFRGFWWNLHADQAGIWDVNDVLPSRIERSRFRTAEAFAKPETSPPRPIVDGVILDDPDFTISAIQLKHHGPSLGFLVREKARSNIDPDKLLATGLKPGPWVKSLKDGSNEIEVDGKRLDAAKLRADLLVETEGESAAYLTDFLLDNETRTKLEAWLAGCETVICEAQYHHADLELALRNHHTTTKLVAGLAKASRIGQLTLFHLSQRYRPVEWLAMLKEAKAIFPNTDFPNHWKL